MRRSALARSQARSQHWPTELQAVLFAVTIVVNLRVRLERLPYFRRRGSRSAFRVRVRLTGPCRGSTAVDSVRHRPPILPGFAAGPGLSIAFGAYAARSS